jgi:hypothetical protein
MLLLSSQAPVVRVVLMQCFCLAGCWFVSLASRGSLLRTSKLQKGRRVNVHLQLLCGRENLQETLTL